MRKSQKKWIEETIALMGEAHEEIRRRLAEQNGDMVRQLLGSCQESAIRLGQLIEETEGEAAPSVESLEQYCEVCWRVYEETEQGNMRNPSGVYRFLQKQLTAADNRIRQTVPVRLEIAFFCYKASMSDCLESIYFAAKADPECDAYFIPIPYYDRGPDGRLGTMHYEGAGYYPETYELTDWREYDVEARRPDIIYIMNPYDNRNYVTSVHPDFYARRLKDLTDCLVYVPYGVHIEPPEPGVGSFSGVFYSDLVFVQSETMRQYYIERLLADNATENLTLRMAREKVVALGTPKTDKLIHTDRDDYILPEDWRKLLNSGAAKKKIVLYNLSIFGALHANEENGRKYLKKLRSSLQFFEGCREVVLWIRPHPLLAQTFRSMRPQICQEYEDMIEQYKRGGWGIYDDTADMNRAVAYADAYYGDRSSIEHFCEFLGKPVLIQNIYSAGEEPTVIESAEEIEKIMKDVVSQNREDCFSMYETSAVEKGDFSLAGFIEHFDIVMKFSDEQSARFRTMYANPDGTAGRKIHEYTVGLLEKAQGE